MDNPDGATMGKVKPRLSYEINLKHAAFDEKWLYEKVGLAQWVCVQHYGNVIVDHSPFTIYHQQGRYFNEAYAHISGAFNSHMYN